MTDKPGSAYRKRDDDGQIRQEFIVPMERPPGSLEEALSAGGLPKLGSEYVVGETGKTLPIRCTVRTARPIRDDWSLWEVVCEYE